MKKTIAVIIASVLLVVGGIGGLVYAQGSHEIMTGQKLVGWGNVGIAPGNKNYIAYTAFNLTNPDCVNQRTIDWIFIFKDDGSAIYEGPPLVGMVATELKAPLEPHQTVDIILPYYVLVFEHGMDPDPSTWPADPKLYWPDLARYTIEIFWSGVKGGLPLTGWSWMIMVGEDEEGNYTIPRTSDTSQMANMEQVTKK
jgi:hypothetical protein